jgi:hypothetical protein
MTGVVCSLSVFFEVLLESILLLWWFNGDKDDTLRLLVIIVLQVTHCDTPYFKLLVPQALLK